MHWFFFFIKKVISTKVVLVELSEKHGKMERSCIQNVTILL